MTTEQFWDERYGQSDRIWSGDPNAALIRETAGLTPGTVLELGCGEGADAIWLAAQGWRVTASDVSRVALARAAEHAAAEGVGDRIDWQRHDLAATFPAGHYDLVTASFLYSPDLPRTEILRTAAAAVTPGGTLLIIGHGPWPDWHQGPHPDIELPTPQQVLTDLDLPTWTVLTCEEYERTQTGPAGQPAVRIDNTLKLHRPTD
ncbi:SAM-dependent methyltransferase [Kitasatospora gansuensis]|uniref:SAM-dependent methyltransferase n=1 Tax=Kitasatospora gansuensis TaxID=258050 RepID=A0A7W7S8P6_9ACTN|nr:class I SAM-dependent methyltransferase [Kitasatospora gansuensis]MBB4945547.1 SAM-dependent methyltransferase [Kitasatospora gansuensis]